MKTMHVLSILFLISLTSCSTTTNRQTRDSSKADPETVLVTYHVKAGGEKDFQEALAQAWDFYRKERLVFAHPHVIARDKEDGGKPRFIEVFTWVSHSAPEHVPNAVQDIWKQMQSLCEARDGRTGVEGGEVDLLTSAGK